MDPAGIDNFVGKSGNFDVTIIGGSQKRRMAHDLIQYLDSSIFVVNQYDHNKSYRLLVAVNDSPHNAKAVKFGVRVSQAFDVDVDLVKLFEVYFYICVNFLKYDQY